MSQPEKVRELEITFTKERAPLAPENQLGVYKLRRWSWTEKQRAIQTATTSIDKERGIIAWDTTIYYEQMLLITVRKSPDGFEWNPENLSILDPDIGDALQQGCLTVNTISGQEKTTFLGQLSSGSTIRGLTNTGPVKPSESFQKAAT